MKRRKPLPDYESPQELLREVLEVLAIDAEELAIRGCLPISLTLKIVEGVAPITDEIADGLERATGIKADRWTLLEHWYEARVRRPVTHEACL